MKFSLDLFMRMNHDVFFTESDEMLKVLSLFDIVPGSIQVIGTSNKKYKEIICGFDEGRKKLSVLTKEGTNGTLKIESVDYRYVEGFYSISESEFEYYINFYDNDAIDCISGMSEGEPHSVLQFKYAGIAPDVTFMISKKELEDNVLSGICSIHEFIYKKFSVYQRKRKKDQDGELPFNI